MAAHREVERAVRAWAEVFMRRSVHAFIVAMKASGLSQSQVHTLMRLHYRGACPITEIGEELGVTAAAASQIVDRLAGMGLIERAADPLDRRVRQVRLTTRGRGIVARGVEARIAWVRDLARRVPADELDSVVAALKRLTQAAAELEPATSAGASPRRVR